ncbi:MAG: mutAa [Rhodospirillaceae bacterium]|nr:MAG: mutAa [Rhodospirillaceae bacterium]
MSDENLVLAGDFPAASYEEWHEAVDKALKGAPFEKKMVTRTYEGITIHPIYTRRDWLAEGDPSGFPGTQPFSRGFNAAGREGWCVRQEQAASDPKVANAAILADLEHGATSLVLRLDRAARAGLDPDKAGIESAGVDGIMAYSLADFDDVLNKVRFDVVPIALVTGAQFIAGAALLAALWQKQGVTNDKAKGAFNADPLGILAETGTLSVPVETALAQMADLAAYTARTWPHVTAVGVDTTPYDDAGATETQNLACAMATAVTYLRTMTGAGMDVNAACRQISFTVSCDFFLSIAKLRAARKMWARITESCGATGEACAARIHARTAERMITRCDPWVNMLRTTTAAFAAGIAGANSVTALPFDYALGQSDDSAQRIARNGQIILREESSLTKVIDPAGGAWYVESLTDQLARIAWELFQTIEKAGGMAKALGNGTIADQIASVWATREKNIAHRRDPIAGVSEFPNITEVVPVRPSPDHKALLEKARKEPLSAAWPQCWPRHREVRWSRPSPNTVCLNPSRLCAMPPTPTRQRPAPGQPSFLPTWDRLLLTTPVPLMRRTFSKPVASRRLPTTASQRQKHVLPPSRTARPASLSCVPRTSCTRNTWQEWRQPSRPLAVRSCSWLAIRETGSRAT